MANTSVLALRRGIYIQPPLAMASCGRGMCPSCIECKTSYFKVAKAIRDITAAHNAGFIQKGEAWNFPHPRNLEI